MFGKKKNRKEQKKARRIQLELDEDVKAELKAMSDELGVSQSQIMQYLFLTGDIKGITKYLENSSSPVWKSKVNFDRLRRDLGKK